jgi:endonuclease YncB( thermonuclease family)
MFCVPSTSVKSRFPQILFRCFRRSANNTVINNSTLTPPITPTPTHTTIVSDKNFLVDGTDISWEDTREFRFPTDGGRVIKVYDGDTITIASKLPYDSSLLYRLSVRLNGIDTPEMKGKDITDDEKTAAKLARDFVSNLILNKYVRLENIETEKYGRILADVYIGDVHLNQLLLKERYAVIYDGGTKKKPKSWLKYRLSG